MIIHGNQIPDADGRRPYPLDVTNVVASHFVERTTLPENPFGPHAHAQPELWYILEGEGLVRLGEAEHAVTAGDLITIPGQIVHGLQTTSRVRWLCLG